MDIFPTSFLDEVETIEYKIVKLKVRACWMDRVGKKMWITKEDAENFIKNVLKWDKEIGYREED